MRRRAPRHVVAILAALTMQCGASTSAPPPQSARSADSSDAPTLEYTLHPVTREDGARLEVSLCFTASAAGTTKLLLPDRHWGEERFYDGIRNLRATSPGATLVPATSPSERGLTAPAGQRACVGYDLVSSPGSVESDTSMKGTCSNRGLTRSAHA